MKSFRFSKMSTGFAEETDRSHQLLLLYMNRVEADHAIPQYKTAGFAISAITHSIPSQFHIAARRMKTRFVFDKWGNGQAAWKP